MNIVLRTTAAAKYGLVQNITFKIVSIRIFGYLNIKLNYSLNSNPNLINLIFILQSENGVGRPRNNLF